MKFLSLCCAAIFALLKYSTTFSLAAAGNNSAALSSVFNSTSYRSNTHLHNCNSYSDCKASLLGVHSSCNVVGDCVCDMNYEEVGGHCQAKASCTGDLSCTISYGFFSHCSAKQNGFCYCEASHYFDTQEQRCNPKSANSQNTVNHCSTDGDCHRPLGTSSACSPEGTCHCKAGFSVDADQDAICVPIRVVPTTHCDPSSEDASYETCKQALGGYSSCNSQGRCICWMGFEPVWSSDKSYSSSSGGHFTCQLKSCRSSQDCWSKYGQASCDRINTCVCSHDYYFDRDSERCKQFPSVKLPHTDSSGLPSVVLYIVGPGMAVSLVVLAVVVTLVVRRRQLRRRLQERGMASPGLHPYSQHPQFVHNSFSPPS